MTKQHHLAFQQVLKGMAWCSRCIACLSMTQLCTRCPYISVAYLAKTANNRQHIVLSGVTPGVDFNSSKTKLQESSESFSLADFLQSVIGHSKA